MRSTAEALSTGMMKASRLTSVPFEGTIGLNLGLEPVAEVGISLHHSWQCLKNQPLDRQMMCCKRQYIMLNTPLAILFVTITSINN